MPVSCGFYFGGRFAGGEEKLFAKSLLKISEGILRSPLYPLSSSKKLWKMGWNYCIVGWGVV